MAAAAASVPTPDGRCELVDCPGGLRLEPRWTKSLHFDAVLALPQPGSRVRLKGFKSI